jgi:hypothetical protein
VGTTAASVQQPMLRLWCPPFLICSMMVGFQQIAHFKGWIPFYNVRLTF